MKKFIGKIAKWLFLFTFVILVIAVIVLGVGFYIKNRDLNNIYAEYNKATQSLNQNDKENQITIDNLQQSYKDLNDKVTSLTQENNDLQARLLTEGFGAIKGKILPFLVGDSSFSQYQLVCAENVKNKNVQYCLSVSGIVPQYTLSLPAGTYVVSAELLSSDGKTILTTYSATYSEYVKCVEEKGVDKCDKAQLSAKTVQVSVKAGETTENVDPTDWITTKVTP